MNVLKLLKSMFTHAPRISPADCKSRIRSGEALLVDVREPGEWASGVAESARLLPLSDLTGKRREWSSMLSEARNREILLYCAAGSRSGMAAKILTAEGFNAANTGGIGAWEACGWPIRKPGQSKRTK